MFFAFSGSFYSIFIETVKKIILLNGVKFTL